MSHDVFSIKFAFDVVQILLFFFHGTRVPFFRRKIKFKIFGEIDRYSRAKRNREKYYDHSSILFELNL